MPLTQNQAIDLSEKTKHLWQYAFALAYCRVPQVFQHQSLHRLDFLGLGAMLRIENTIKFSEKFLATLAYGHNFNLPLPSLGSLPNNTYTEEGKAEQRWLQTGVLSLVFHFRFLSIKQKI